MWILYPPDFPKLVSKVQFDECFKVPAKYHLAEATTSRDLLAQAIGGGHQNAVKVIDQCTDYLPRLAGVICAADDPEVAALCKGKPRTGSFTQFVSSAIGAVQPIEMQWRSGLNSASIPADKPFASFKQALQFERCMVLVTLADAYLAQVTVNLALVATEDLSDALIQMGVANCAKAAGIFQFASETTPESLQDTLDVVQFPEGFTRILQGLCAYASACTAQFSYEAARRKAGMNQTLKAKLAMMVAEQCDKANKCFAVSSGVSAGLQNHILGCTALYRSIACKHLAEAQWEEENYGAGVTFIKRSMEHIGTVERILQSVSLASIKSVYEREAPVIKQTAATYEKENNMVYYQTCPPLESLPPTYGVQAKPPEKYVPAEPRFRASDLTVKPS